MMKTSLVLAVLVATATLGTAAYARGDDYRDRDWQEHRHDDWRHHERHDHWRYDHRRPAYAYDYDYRPAYAYGHDYRPAPRYEVERPVVFLPLPPPPHVVLRELLHGHH